MKSLDGEQIPRLLTAIETEPDKYRLAVKLLLYTGARRGEILGLTWKDINFETCTVTINKASLYLPEKGVFQDTPKTDSSRRVNRIPQSLAEELRRFKQAREVFAETLGDYWQSSGHIFTQDNGKPMHPDSVTDWLRKFITRYNKDKNEEEKLPLFSPHNLRHTTASVLIASGYDIRTVASLLGHAQTSTTLNIYSHAVQSVRATAVDTLEEAFTTGKCPRPP